MRRGTGLLDIVVCEDEGSCWESRRWGVDERCFLGAGPACEEDGGETDDVEAAL